MLQRTKQTLIKNWSSFLAFAFVLIWAIVPSTASAQTSLNLDQFRREHLITHGAGEETGNVAIYVSFPNWFGKAGYCPVRVRVVPRKGLQFKENGELKIVVGTGYGFSFDGESNRQVVINVPIEAGTTVASKEVLGNFLLGSNGGFDMLNIKTKLNGRNLRDQQVYMYSGRGGNAAYECKYLCLISAETSQGDNRRLEALAEMAQTGRWYSQESNVTAVGYSSAYCDVRKMPDNWLYLSSLEAISIAFEDLDRMDANGLERLNQYILAGGYLSISKVPGAQDIRKYLPIDLAAKYLPQKSAYQNSSNMDDNVFTLQSFEPPSLDFIEDTIWDNYQRSLGRSFVGVRQTYGISGDPIARFPADLYEGLDWLGEDVMQAGKAALDSELAPAIQFASYFYNNLSVVASSKTISAEVETKASVDIKYPVLYAHGFGKIYLTDKRRSDSHSFVEGDQNTLLNANRIGSTMILITNNRTGRLAGGIGDDFWDWLIPSVGKTPAIPFLIFVVLFVGVGAPGIMYWSNKHKRRVWLVVLMPILATVCTLFLFSYGLLKDGFGAISRSRSLTFVDEKGNGMVWSRQTYFAGSVNNQGVKVGPETYFAPMPVNQYSTMPVCQHVESVDSQQYLGVLPPRLQTQFSLTHPLRNLSIVKRTPETDTVLKAPAVQNDANFTWTKAVFVGPHDEFYVAADVKPGQQCAFTLSDRDEAAKILQKEYKSQPLVAPADSPSADQTSLAKTFADTFSFRPAVSNSYGQISEESTWSLHVGKFQSDQTVMTPGSFVIFTREAPYLEKCLPIAKEQDGLHMIVGRW